VRSALLELRLDFFLAGGGPLARVLGGEALGLSFRSLSCELLKKVNQLVCEWVEENVKILQKDGRLAGG
jgi:hypothetical protein